MKIGDYFFKTRMPDGNFTTSILRVAIIGESLKSYHVKLLQRGPSGQYIGTKYWARKHNVKNIYEAEKNRHEIENIRMPYKD
jgi:hypothetical protein